MSMEPSALYESTAHTLPHSVLQGLMRWLLMTTGCPHTEEVGREVYPPARFWFLAWFFSHFLALNQIEPHNCRGSKTFLPVNFRKLAKGSICKAPNKRRYLSEGSFHSEILLICVSAISFRGILSLTVK